MNRSSTGNPIMILALAVGMLAGPAFAQEATPAAREQSFRSSLMLDDYARVEYQAADGTPLDFEAFMRAMSVGKSFSMIKEDDHSLATVKVAGASTKGHVFVPETLVVGSALPEIGSMPVLDGQAFTDADLRGRYTLLSFFFAECVPCVAEVPALNTFAATHPEVGVYAVTFDDADTARGFVRERGLALPVLADAQAYIDKLALKTYPTMLLVDPEGRIAAVRHGGGIGGDALSAAGLESWIDSAR